MTNAATNAKGSGMKMTPKANKLILNKRNELIFTEGNVWIPLGDFPTKSLGVALDALADNDIQCCFTTSGDHGDQDKKTYTRRLRSLPAWYVFDGFKNQVLDGHSLSHVFVGRLQRIMP